MLTEDIIRNYTRESGVRNLEREIAKIARKLVKRIDAKEKVNTSVNEKDLNKLLGVQKFKYIEIEEEENNHWVNNRTCLDRSWKSEILKIESAVMPGKGKMQIT